MPTPSPTTVALIGFMGSGKSTIGAALAARLGLPLVDLDQRIARRHGPLPTLFDRLGEDGFRALEREELRAVPHPCVLATGGGTPIDPRNRVWLARHCTTVHLEAPLVDCAERVGTGAGRPLWSSAAARFADREPIYATADHVVDARGSVESVLERVLAALADPSERVGGPGGYPIHLAPSLDGLPAVIDSLAPDRTVIVTDDRVASHWSGSLPGDLPRLVFPNGEPNKTLSTWSSLVDGLLAHRVGRASLVVALGGGVVGDVAGFAAGVVTRGVRVLQVPTTPLAMLDSSVGGKTAVNHPAGKNLVGAFHPPSAVYVADETLSTLDERNRRAGLAEAVKMALTHGPATLDLIDAAGTDLLDQPGVFLSVLRQCVRIKAGVVERDLREAGERKLLNLGHSVAHALEAERGFGRLLHGEAVAIGLVQELRWMARHGHTEGGLPDRVARILRALGLPTELPDDLERTPFLEALQVDKKARHDMLDLPCVAEPGRTEILRVSPHQLGTEILTPEGPSSP